MVVAAFIAKGILGDFRADQGFHGSPEGGSKAARGVWRPVRGSRSPLGADRSPRAGIAGNTEWSVGPHDGTSADRYFCGSTVMSTVVPLVIVL